MNKNLSAVIEDGRRSATGTAFPLEEADDAWADPTASKGNLKSLDNLYEETMRNLDGPKESKKLQRWMDFRAALALTWRTQRAHLFTVWVHVPIGIVIILLFTWGWHLAIDASPWNFPAALVGMLTLFAILLMLNGLSLLFPGSRKAKQEADLEKGAAARLQTELEQKSRRRFVDPLLVLLSPPCDFLLRNMSVLFTTSIMMIPVSGAVHRGEIGLIMAWFAATQVLGMLVPLLFCLFTGWAARRLMRKSRRAALEKQALDNCNGQAASSSAASILSGETAVEAPPEQLRRGDVAQLRGNVVEIARQQGEFAGRSSLPSPGGWASEMSPRRSSHSPTTLVLQHSPAGPRQQAGLEAGSSASPTDAEDADVVAALAPTAVERLSDRMARSITPVIYTTVLIIGLPLFYAADFPLPLFLAVPVLSFLFAINVVPANVRQVAHPILTSSFVTFVSLWGLGEAKGWNIYATIQAFNHGNARYINLLNPHGYHGPVPGAGDVFASLLDAALVSLALPMYRYRQDLWQNALRIALGLVPVSALSLFAWPPLGKLIGLSPGHALAFAGRFLSSDLGVKLASTFDADEALTTLLIVFGGVIVAIVKDPLFRLFRVKETDNLTMGVTVGVTGAAIGASSLVNRPRAMAIATLSYVLFGLTLLFLTSFAPVVNLVQNLSGGAPDMIAAAGLGNDGSGSGSGT